MMEDLSAPVDEFITDCGLDDFIQQPEPSVPFVGLWNLGNSCFFNSVLQILFYCPGFQKTLEKHKRGLQAFFEADDTIASAEDASRNQRNKKKCQLLRELQNLFATMRESQNSLICDGEVNSSKNKAVRPSQLMEVLREIYPIFEPYTQQDAQECLRCMLDNLHEALAVLIGDVTPQCENRKPVVSEQSCKVFGGRKSGETCLLSKTNQKSQSENQDPTRTKLKESRTTAARKRGVREVFKSLSRPKALKPEFKKYKPMSPLTENKNSKNITPDEVAALIMDTDKPEGNNEAKNSYFPPLKKKKIGNGISKFYRSSAFCITEKKNSTRSDLMAGSKLTSRSVKAVLKPSTSYKELSVMHSLKEGGLGESHIEETETNFIEYLFQGQLVNEVRCMECESCVRRTEDFMDISLPVREAGTAEVSHAQENTSDQAAMAMMMEGDNEKNHCSVSWGLSSFTSNEILEGENKYYCGNCFRYAEGERRLLLHKLPPVLTLHLKRFSSTKNTEFQYGNSVSKINSCLNVPLELSMEKWSTASEEAGLKYTLFGIIVHSGATICSGHYLAYVRIRSSVFQCDMDEKLHEYSGKWLEADDDRMRLLDENEMADILYPKSIEGTSHTPYLLFYYKEQHRGL